jgi:hypothetical protein
VDRVATAIGTVGRAATAIGTGHPAATTIADRDVRITDPSEWRQSDLRNLKRSGLSAATASARREPTATAAARAGSYKASSREASRFSGRLLSARLDLVAGLFGRVLRD